MMLSSEEIHKNYARLKDLAQEIKNNYDFLYDVKRELGKIQHDISVDRTVFLKEANDKEKHSELKNSDLRECFVKERLVDNGKTKLRLDKEEEMLKYDYKIKSLTVEFRAIRIILETEAQLVATLYGKKDY